MLRNLFEGLKDLIYPKTCVVCKSSLKGKTNIDDLICRQCWNKLKRNPPPFCHACGRHLEARNLHKNLCPACLKKPMHFDRAFSPYQYEGVIKEMIHAFKYSGKDYLGPTLGKLLVEFIREYSLPLDVFDAIIPVPLHQARLREREFNQAQILGESIAKEFQKNIIPGILERNRDTRTQTELKDQERYQNVKGSFAVKDLNAVRGKNILLVDDVLTTGATCSEAACALKDARAGIVFVLTLAS